MYDGSPEHHDTGAAAQTSVVRLCEDISGCDHDELPMACRLHGPWTTERDYSSSWGWACEENQGQPCYEACCMALDQREEEGLQARGRLHEETLARWSE